MYIILVYDINEEKVNKVMKLCRQYLIHVQNSVFEGEITCSKYRKLLSSLKKIIDLNKDSIIIFQLLNSNFKRELIGIEKRVTQNIF